MKDKTLSFSIGVLFATVMYFAVVYKNTKANAGEDHYLLTPSQCLTWALTINKK